MNKEVQLRPMQAEDYHDILGMMAQLHAMHAGKRPDLFEQTPSLMPPDAFLEMLTDPDRLAVTAVCDGQIAGFGIAKRKLPSPDPVVVKHKTLYIDDIFVQPGFRKQQIGHAILEYLERAGKEWGADRIDLTVWPFNENAMRFYKQHGMQEQRLILEKPL